MNTPQTQPEDTKLLRLAQRVGWGDCDPAGIIYTPRVLDYAMQTLEAWNREILGVSWIKLNREMSMGFPTVRVEIDFISAPAVDDEVTLELKVEKLGRSSLTSIITGFGVTGAVYFHVTVISCLVSVPVYKAQEIPAEFRQRILAYQAAYRDNA